MNKDKYALYSKWNKEYKQSTRALMLALAEKYQSEVERVCKLYGVNFITGWIDSNNIDAKLCFETPYIQLLNEGGEAGAIGNVIGALETELLTALNDMVLDAATEQFVIVASVLKTYRPDPEDYEWVYMVFQDGYHYQPDIVKAEKPIDKDECLACGPISRQLGEALIEMREYEPLSYWIRTIQELF